MQQITSLQNPLVKYLFTLTQKSKQRKEHQQFLIEGKREITLALQAGYLIHLPRYPKPGRGRKTFCRV